MTEYHGLGDSYNSYVFSHSCVRLELQGQGIGRCGLFGGLSAWLAHGRLLTASSHGFFSVRLSGISSSFKVISSID